MLTPLSGDVIHAVPCEALGGGWGGWFVLRADTPRCGASYLLFGHLAHRGLPRQGERLTEGSLAGVIGAPDENGGWYPHLHLQALSAAAWDAVQHAPDTLLDGYACAAANLDRLFPDPAPLVMAAGWQQHSPPKRRGRPTHRRQAARSIGAGVNSFTTGISVLLCVQPSQRAGLIPAGRRSCKRRVRSSSRSSGRRVHACRSPPC